jgi:hypothetical protein
VVAYHEAVSGLNHDLYSLFIKALKVHTEENAGKRAAK